MRLGSQPPRRPFVVEKKGEQKPFKPKPWSHQSDLRAQVGKTLILWIDGEPLHGVLVEADQFTLKMRPIGVNGKSSVTYFKHAITAYTIEA